MHAPASFIFPQVNDLHKWEAWSPWETVDPGTKKTFEGPASGIGAVYRWSGNKVGAGGMTITESRPSDLIRIKLEFLRPFKGTNAVEFTFASQGEQTEVTWSMSGEKNFPVKIFSLFINCDGMCEKQFDKGLAQLKSVVEETPQTVAG